MPAVQEIATTSTTLTPTELEVERMPVPRLDALAREWRELQARADHSFFMSWAWIGAWLAALPGSVPRSLLRVRAGERTVGLAIVCERTLVRGVVIRSRGLFVNCTGDPTLDELTIEYNDVLVEQGLEDRAFRAILQFLLRDPAWDELFLQGWRDADGRIAEACKRFGLGLARQRVRPCHVADLKGHALDTDFVETLPARVRYKVRRTLREAERLGALRLDVASTPAEAAGFLAGLKALHQRSWTSRGQAGSFANDFFDRFHKAFVVDRERTGAVQLLRVSIGDVPVGYVYNFVHQGQVFNYQSGFDFGFDPSAHWRPGLLTHLMCIEFNRVAGLNAYDLLAGDQPYKREFGNRTNSLLWAAIQRPRNRFRLERLLKSLKRALSPPRKPAAAGDA